MNRVAELTGEVHALLGAGTLKGVVLFPGKDSLAALERLCSLFPSELIVYTSSSEPDLSSLAATARSCEVRVALSQAVVLRDYLAPEDAGRDGAQTGSQQLEEPGRHFLMRGDLLSLETLYKATHRLAEEKPDERGQRTFLCQVGLIDAEWQGRDRRAFFAVSDCFMNAAPDKSARMDIIRNSVAVWKALSEDPARVALLSAIEQVYPGVPVTVESADVAAAAKDCVPEAYVQGPLSFDVALDAEAARDKGAAGDVAGRANVLVGSSVEVSNGIYVALTLTQKAPAASVLVGGSVPLALPFPSDGVDTAFNSICLAALLSLKRERS